MQGHFQSGKKTTFALVNPENYSSSPLGHTLCLHMQLGTIETMAEHVGTSKHNYV